MEENKNCCDNEWYKKMNNCYLSKKCCSWNNCHLLRYLLLLLVIIMTFCLGSQFGELKSQTRNFHNCRSGMMNWNYKFVKPIINSEAPVIVDDSTPELSQ